MNDVRIEVMPDLRARLRGENDRGAVLVVRDRYSPSGEWFPKILWQGNFRGAAERDQQVAAAEQVIGASREEARR